MKEYFREQFNYVKGRPFSWELIPARKDQKYRIMDREDDPVGSASTQKEAEEMVDELNKYFPGV